MTLDATPPTPSASPRQAEAPDWLSAWGRICYDTLDARFAQAHQRLPRYVAAELHDLEEHLAQALELPLVVKDLQAFAQHDGGAADLSSLVLPSEAQRAERFARLCMDPDALDAHLLQTFNLVTDALARRHGEARALALSRQAWRDFSPVRREALRRLRVGPPWLRPFLGPPRFLAGPLGWGVWWVIDAGARRRSAVRAVLRDVSPAFADGDRLRRGWQGELARGVWFGGLCVLAGGLTSALACRLLDVERMVADMLDEVEELLLFGSLSDDPLAPSYGEGLLALLARLEAAESAD